MLFQLSAAFLLNAFLVTAAPAATTVKLDSATVTGKSVGSVQQFLGIPFAKPPYAFSNDCVIVDTMLTWILQRR